MTLTWRQLDAYLEFSNHVDGLDLTLNAIGAQGDGETIKKMIQELTK